MRTLPFPVGSTLQRTCFPDALEGFPATVPELLAARSGEGSADFVVGREFRLTFGEADKRSAAIAAQLLAAGVGKGTRVGVLFPNGPEWAVSWLAAARIGALTVPLSTFSPGAELGRALHHADVHAVLSAPRVAEQDLRIRLETALPGLVESGPELALSNAPYLRWIHVDADAPPGWSFAMPRALSAVVTRAAEAAVVPADALAIISTSGATAAPKAVLHTQGSLIRHAALLAARRGLTSDDRIYSPMPFFWVGGLTMVLLAALSSGAAALVQDRFEAGEALDLAERERATQISCWPNAARAMAEHPTFAARDLSHVRGGTLVEALPAAQRPPTPDRAPIPLGMTETGGPHTGVADPYGVLPEELRGTFGQPLPGVEHLVVDRDSDVELARTDLGELLVRGPFVMEALYKRERHETFTPDGWYATGDLGRFDDDGNLLFAGRGTTMIKSGGSNISPAEVEAALLRIDGVRAVFVLGVPAGDRGEDVAAVIATATGSIMNERDLTRRLRAELSSFKVPRRYRFVTEPALPMLPTGKVDLVGLRALFDADAC